LSTASLLRPKSAADADEDFFFFDLVVAGGTEGSVCGVAAVGLSEVAANGGGLAADGADTDTLGR
jgi:hypothetical protein